MYKLTESINQAINQCKETGAGDYIYLNDTNNTKISFDWEEWEVDNNYDIITIYIYQNNIIQFTFQVEETKILRD